MSTRITALVAVLMVAAVLAAQQPDRGTTTGSAGVPSTTLDGDWTVVSAATDGTAVDKAGTMTVSIKNNTVTFGGAGADHSKMKAMRLEFGPHGTVQVTEAGADGKFDTQNRGGTGGTGTGTTGAGTTGSTGTGGTGSAAAGPMNGVYVMTPDFLAICVHTSGTGATATGTRGTGTGTGAETKPGQNGTQPGGTGTTGKGGTTPGPQMKSHISVVLKRGGAAGAGTTGGARQ